MRVPRWYLHSAGVTPLGLPLYGGHFPGVIAAVALLLSRDTGYERPERFIVAPWSQMETWQMRILGKPWLQVCKGCGAAAVRVKGAVRQFQGPGAREHKSRGCSLARAVKLQRCVSGVPSGSFASLKKASVAPGNGSSQLPGDWQGLGYSLA
eukprot:s13_g22.t1